MANPVVDNELTDWQPDALGDDSNLPVATTPMGTGQSGELAGELRLIKSVVRGISIAMSWERWLGILSSTALTDIAFTYVSATTFRVNDNFTVGSGLGVAELGRRVMATVASGNILGTITNAVFSSPNTVITVTWDSTALDATLTEVQFGVRTDAVPPTNISAVTLIGDVTGPSSANVVGKIQGIPVTTTDPLTGQVLTFNGSQYVPSYAPPASGTLLTNLTGGALTVGDVVATQAAGGFAVVLADSLATQKQLLVAQQSIANNQTGLFASGGILLVNCTGTVFSGNYLYKSATSLLAQDSGIAMGNAVDVPNGAFAVALTGLPGPGLGQVYAAVFGVTFSSTASGGGGNTVVMFDGGVNKVSRTSETGFANVSIAANIGANIATTAILQVTLTCTFHGIDPDLHTDGSIIGRFRKGGSGNLTSLANIQTGGFSRGSPVLLEADVKCFVSDTIFVPVDSSFIFQYDLVATLNDATLTISEYRIDLMGYVY